MNHRREVRVVEVEHVGRRRVEERRGQHVGPLGPAEHGGLRRPADRAEHRGRVLERGVAASAERGAEMVEQRALGLVTHRGGHLLPPRCGNEFGEPAGEVAIDSHGADGLTPPRRGRGSRLHANSI